MSQCNALNKLPMKQIALLLSEQSLLTFINDWKPLIDFCVRKKMIL